MVAMKWVLGVSWVFVSAAAFAEEGVTTGSFPVERRNVVTVSIPLQSLGQVSLEGERVLGERFSVGLGVSATFSHDRTRFEEEALTGREGYNRTFYQFGLAPSARFYLTGRAPEGLWLSPRLEVGVGRSSNWTLGALSGTPEPEEQHTDNWSLGGMAVLGYTVVVDPGFTVQGGVGLGARRDVLAYDTLRLGEGGMTEWVPVHQSSWNLTQRIVVNLGWAF
ncbi:MULTISPECIES: autotransporter outer membrane beta-barrel domain-containing protein [unclassified Corallococcus]|uniref:autotransporter outer membrane beta-barrel domain-containing protein n=1 Tax=unclassified Corallococcus TaxID=2685029 RepID=UPI001A8DA88F|nr:MULTISPECIES: autotransporter outer membrane beta-barrel domain-containing protein [unclassified Corallococcus]MBN9681861.1 autotransporter outer membrane beta-barrel domain-containing protein [Corallococcus sp. NCSPR001]WAS86569.1 autotransporter outer membrane beta-barrel domain-containing protein [Corallococcus sp. NCRR]